jgi:hypothetical protein
MDGALSDELDVGEAVVVEQLLYIGADPWYAGFTCSMQSVCLVEENDDVGSVMEASTCGLVQRVHRAQTS